MTTIRTLALTAPAVAGLVAMALIAGCGQAGPAPDADGPNDAAAPAATTAEQAPTMTEPPTTTEEPAPTTEEVPPTTTEEPAPTTEEAPPTTTAEPPPTTAEEQPPTTADASAAGEQVFASAGCGSCHTLAAAGSSGAIGPNLDDEQPDVDEVAEMVREGGNGMPSFAGQLSAAEIEAVALYVAQATGGSLEDESGDDDGGDDSSGPGGGDDDNSGPGGGDGG
jgi:mono/diheme cytochrome c family protein